MAKKKEKTISPLYVHNNPKSTISEKFRGIRSNIMFSGANSEIKSLIVTSEKPASGKSTITANIAITYAQAGYNTLIIDGDMRKPTQQNFFNLANHSGLSNLIIGKALQTDAIKETHIENLNVLTSGPIPPNPSELITSTNFHELLKKLTDDFDFILIDTPPVTTVTDAQLYAKNVRDCVLVIDGSKNEKNEVKKAKELLIKSGGKVIGAVLNKMTIEKGSSYYYYYGDE
ncbi:polysaccharide biosynthesis tyrosine autokinase [Staphylococcus xylosus]|uniref:polysaccharide biosynthesis tyrosine autokinase n=1 Tax=Staphylococcus TaxID=1279 RepID=UPI00049B09E6|nr:MULTISPECIES: polysaccharide biosynthesis tyrosine autokinase [Staphylococcus]AID02730.1 capsular biosynthesis protein [Staphylococcus xylosus]MEB7811294.1 polysaccharide biosynthesis tyrosine autokinase [Staphylococcus xylosus]MEB7814498.1 polysaccharide biosynthesis tyrosine autokinase [Staphylococcus xylosus]MEB7865530.1 polysaccharide biosynthesis tyrosine autokinase [Staphylococcus xylosus]